MLLSDAMPPKTRNRPSFATLMLQIRLLAKLFEVQLNRWRCLLVASCLAVGTSCPALAQYQVHWGDVHGHTRHSDGKGTLDDFFVHARDVSKLDFAIVTDHDFGNGKPTWSMPKETWSLTQNKANEYTVTGKFVAIAGYEWTSQRKYWTDVEKNIRSERLFSGPPKAYDHKNVYFPSRVEYIFSAKDSAYKSPNQLAEAVRRHGGLIHTNHPMTGPDGEDRWDYDSAYDSVIANVEIGPDTSLYKGQKYEPGFEKVVRQFLNGGGKSGFVGGSDTHEGKPVARTAVFASELTREAIFDALRHRHNYAVSNARIILSFEIDGHMMGEEIETKGKPKIAVNVQGTDTISEVVIVRDGSILHSLAPAANRVKFEYVDDSYEGNSYYYLRVTQVDKDIHGNPSRAWSSPIWVKGQTSVDRSRFIGGDETKLVPLVEFGHHKQFVEIETLGQ